ncbi:MAG: FG-GAP-like repeat-containing protein [Myxococcota bacterium]
MRVLPFSVLCALVVAGCSIQSELNPKDKDRTDFDTGDTDDVPTDTDDTDPPAVEECNGTDDDGDGLIDEGFPDANLNGRADCLDAECPALELGAEGPIAINAECQGETSGGGAEVVNPWAVRTQWTYRGHMNSWMTPVIGNLDDDNGDGRIDEDDSPEVVFTADNYVVALEGSTGVAKWTYPGNSYAGTLIADIDSDGAPDVVSADSSGRTIALEGDGTLKWTANDMLSSLNYMIHNVADLDEDGNPEILHDQKVLNGEDGTSAFDMLVTTGGFNYRLPAIADVDNDGDQEIALEGALYDSDGTLLWDTGEVGTYGFWPVIIQADSDPEAEIGFVGANWTLWNHDGTQIYSVNYGTPAQPGPPCAGDFDGDGEAEVAWPSYQNFVAYELDGTQMWSVPMDDTSGLAGCSGYDLNNDGALEILFADQSSFTIFDGSTGAELYSDTNHASPTIFEYPTVADIDADGHAEIVVAHYGSGFAITAYEHDGDGWPAAGTTWNVHDFAITNINPDGSVPQEPEASWLKYNVYRARVAADDPSTPDLTVSITDVCVADCDFGPIAVGVQVGNEGGADVSEGALLTLYAEEKSGPRPVATYPLPAIPAGTVLAGIEFELTPDDVGIYGFSAAVDSDDTVSECVETNNVDEWSDASCP